MHKLFHAHAPTRIFGISALLTIGSLIGVLFGFGIGAAIVTLVLMIVEIAFSFDNAIINARVLARLSPFWQQLFLTVGIVIAVIGMRVLFPLLIVSISAHISIGSVLHLALQQPEEYAHKLEAAHPAIVSFGGAFLLVLALEFFIDSRRKITWLDTVEKPLQRIDRAWVPVAISTIIVAGLAALPANTHASTTLVAGMLGIITHVAIELLTKLFDFAQPKQSGPKVLTGFAALSTFLYLQVLDASFSFDGVIGAFAISDKVILIAIGLGVGAVWVRSLTVFMVRRKTLDKYIFLEHGAHYTVILLAGVLLASLFFEVPEAVSGIVGVSFVAASIISSRRAAINGAH